MYGIFSNHSLDDPTAYPDDVVLHTADQDCFPYYRRMGTLEDTPAMDGNCKIARAGWGKNEMYPCIDSHVRTQATPTTNFPETFRDRSPVVILR